MSIKNTLRLSVSVSTSAAQCWSSCTSAAGRSIVDGNLMVGVCLVWWVALSRRPKKREPDLQFTGNIRQKRGTASNMISTSDLLMYSRLVRADRVKGETNFREV